MTGYLFIIYFFSAFVTYAALHILYAYELTQRWHGHPSFYSKRMLMLCIVKGAHWGASMELEQAWGAAASAILTSFVFFGLQRAVDLQLANKTLPSPLYRLWSLSFLSLASMVDSYIHLAVFTLLSAYCNNHSLLLGLANVAGHTLGMLTTYPVTAYLRGRARWWDGFRVHYVRSSMASFLISFLASFFISFSL